jgi:hypothetical protein
MYKLIKGGIENKNYGIFRSNEDGTISSFIFDPANTDYAEFKKAVAEGAELQDADGNVMSAEAAQAFVGTLP